MYLQLNIRTWFYYQILALKLCLMVDYVNVLNNPVENQEISVFIIYLVDFI